MDDNIKSMLMRIEQKLDMLIEALAGEEEVMVDSTTLDGERYLQAERDQTRPL